MSIKSAQRDSVSTEGSKAAEATSKSMSAASMTVASIDASLWCFRVGQLGLLVSLFWKFRFFRAAISVYDRVTLKDDFFPKLLTSLDVAIAMVLVVTLSAVFSLFASGRIRILLAGAGWLAVTVLCLHQMTYNDATFTTMWWTALWTFWLSTQLEKTSSDALTSRAAFLSRLIVSMILLGGAVGKWTSEYWSGEVLYEIYFADRDFWLFNVLRHQFQGDSLRNVATYYSRGVVLTETVVGLTLWMMPARWGATIGFALLAGVALFSNFLLFSVMACLMAILTSGWWVKKQSKDAVHS